MGKVSELSMLVDELKKCGETLIGISEELTELEKQPKKRVLLRRRSQSRPRKKS